MKSLKELYRIGPGPSSSHTLGPQRACVLFKQEHPTADHYCARLFGSLALTGKGHHTDSIIMETMKPKECKVQFLSGDNLKHPNTMILIAYDNQNEIMDQWTIYSVGGGAIRIEGFPDVDGLEVYPHTCFEDIKDYCHEQGITLNQYIDAYEDVDDYLSDILDQMLLTIKNGLQNDGILPGKLKLKRIGKSLYEEALTCSDESTKQKLLLSAYAYCASEENAAGGMTVTSPTLGSSGVIPSILYHFYYDLKKPRALLIEGLKVASIFGNLIKSNATISGAQGGCQAEIGAACAMGAAMCAFFFDLDKKSIEYAAEMGIEHHLGLTCDPVGGYVMIPCIERNAVATLRSLDAALLSKYLMKMKDNKVTFDMVVKTMNYTGQHIAIELKETSLGGLAIEVPMDEC